MKFIKNDKILSITLLAIVAILFIIIYGIVAIRNSAEYAETTKNVMLVLVGAVVNNFIDKPNNQ